MSSTIFEQIRDLHENIEHLEEALYEAVRTNPKKHREALLNRHRIANYMGEGQRLGQKLLNLHTDADGAKREATATMSGPNMFQTFYERLKGIREYHNKFGKQVQSTSSSFLFDLEPELKFSGEELSGRNLDLHVHHEEFLNIPGAPRLDYIAYLDGFRLTEDFPRDKKSKPYLRYLNRLLRTLMVFFVKTRPLDDLESVLVPVLSEFEAAWKAGRVPGWPKKKGAANGASDEKKEPAHDGPIVLEGMKSKAELEALGLDALKLELERRGLKAGGDLKARAERLWAVKGLTPDQYPKKLLAKGKKRPLEATKEPALANQTSVQEIKVEGEAGLPPGLEALLDTTRMSLNRGIAWLEVLVKHMGVLLSSVLESTKKRIENKQTKTFEELEAELEMEEEEEDQHEKLDDDSDSSDDEDKPLWNPLNLPLGWDGKPIPFWLYKLHGLGVEYKCEICGDASYWGRRDFERHFQEWRHAHGMRTLGIPNTKHFHGITLIEDAKALYERLKEKVDVEQFKTTSMEEFEDSEGNVMSRKTYEDLARQGLL